MLPNKWIAGAGTKALSLDMLGVNKPDEQSDQSETQKTALGRTLICLDSETLHHPCNLELSNSNYLDLPFVCTECLSSQARSLFQSAAIANAFVYAADDMSALNVAAALKQDCPSKQVFFVSDNEDAWFLRKTALAGVDQVIPVKHFYREMLARHIKAPTLECFEWEDVAVKDSGAEVYAADTYLPLSCGVEYPKDTFGGYQSIERVGDPDLDCDEIEEAVVNCSRAFYLPVIGASGGAGQSAIAFLTAFCAARLGCKTLLIDLDAQFGDMSLYTQDEQVMSLNQLASNPSLVEQIEPTNEGFCLVGACESPEQSEDVLEALEHVFKQAETCFEVIVSNGPRFWNEQHMTLLERAGKIFFVLDQRMSSARATQKAFDLCIQCGLAASPFLFLLNKCNRQTQLTYLDVTCATHGSLCRELPDGGRLVAEYLEAHQAAYLFDEGNDFAFALFDVVAEVLPGCNSAKEMKQHSRFPHFLFGKKRRKDTE